MKLSRTLSILTVTALVSFAVAGPAHAAGSPIECDFAPNINTYYEVPITDVTYTLPLTNGDFHVTWSSAWNVAMDYHKTGGATITAEFLVFEDYLGSCWLWTSGGFFTQAANTTKTWMLSDPGGPKNPDVYGKTVAAAIAVEGQGDYAITFGP